MSHIVGASVCGRTWEVQISDMEVGNYTSLRNWLKWFQMPLVRRHCINRWSMVSKVLWQNRPRLFVYRCKLVLSDCIG